MVNEDVIDNNNYTKEFLFLINKFRLASKRLRISGKIGHSEFFMLGAIADLTFQLGQEDVCLSYKELEVKHHVTVSEIAQILGATMAATSKMIRGMEQKGLVQRNASQEDGRKVYVSITDYGLEQFQMIVEELGEFTIEIIHRMGKENAKELTRLFTIFHDIMIDIMNERGV